MEPEEKKINRIEDIKSRLFSRDPKAIRKKRFVDLRAIPHAVKTAWDTEKIEQNIVTPMAQKTSLFKKIFIGSIAFFVIALIFAVFSLYRGSNNVSAENIDIVVLGNAFADGGDELPLQVEIQNKNTTTLEYADLIIEYPKGSDGELTGQFERQRLSIGSIAPGKSANENVSLVLYGAQGTTRDIKFTLEYRLSGSNAIFVKEKQYPVVINSAPITLTVDGPTELSPNQEVTLTVKTVLNASREAKNMRIRVEYPPGFQYTTSIPDPIVGNNVWDIGDLGPGVEKKVVIKGKLGGQAQEERSFRVYSGEADPNDRGSIGVAFSSFLHTITLQNPFIDARLVVNGDNADVVAIPAQQPVNVQVAWTNNLPTRVDDVEIKVEASGSALNPAAIIPQGGFYNSNDNTILWDKNTNASFSSLDPGENGVVSFSVASLPLIGSGSSLLSSPNIMLKVSIRGREPSEGGSEQVVSSLDQKELRVSTGLSLITKGFHTGGGIPNSGPTPPKVGQKTTYTIEWSLSNSANAVTGAEVKATLPGYVEWTGVTKPQTEQISYNDVTREVTWRAGTINRGLGIQGGERKVAFQVGITPSLSQVGSVPALILESVLTGIDSYSLANLKVNRALVNTRVTNDTGFVYGNEVVVN